jgi:hypothetical protein
MERLAMTIEESNIVDSIAWHPQTEEVGLTITDHLEWTGDDQTDKEHMLLLQEKINTYLAFIQSGEIYESYPKARGRELVIIVFGTFPMNREAASFFEEIKAFLAKAGYQLRFWPLS